MPCHLRLLSKALGADVPQRASGLPSASTPLLRLPGAMYDRWQVGLVDVSQRSLSGIPTRTRATSEVSRCGGVVDAHAAREQDKEQAFKYQFQICPEP